MMIDSAFIYGGILLTLLVLLVVSRVRPAGLFAIALLACWCAGFIDTNTLTANIANQGLLTLLLLMSVSIALERTAFLRQLSSRIISNNYHFTLFKLTVVSSFASAFLNNTAVVSTLVGVVKKSGVHPSRRLLLPLSYAAILGGTVTLIGTSTNLIINSFLQEKTSITLSMFSFAPIGIAVTLGGLVVIMLTSHWLPKTHHKMPKANQYLTEVTVSGTSSLIGKSIQDNGLRDLDGLFLVEIVRAEKLIAPVGPHHRIAAGDKLIFTGDMTKVMLLEQFDGLALFAHSNGLLRSNVTEVILAHTSDLAGKTLKSTGFRAKFDAAVVAIHRNGSHLSGKLGEITLAAGDRLMLATGNDFGSRHNLDKNFYFVSDHQVQRPFSQWQELAILGGFSSIVTLAVTNVMPLVQGLLFFMLLLMMTGCLSASDVKRRFPFDLLVIIVSALGLANAFEGAGLTQHLSDWLMANDNISPFMALVGVYLLTLLITETITNNAAAALMFPLAYGVATSLGVAPMTFVMAVAFGASASFLSPYGYQTNLIVFNAGQYRFKDFIIAGIPLSIVYSAVVLYLLPIIFPF